MQKVFYEMKRSDLERAKGSLVSWKKVLSSKEEGGLGIKDLLSWNTAAVGKRIWDLLVGKSSLRTLWITKTKLKRLVLRGLHSHLIAAGSGGGYSNLHMSFKSFFVGNGEDFDFWFYP